MSKLRRRGLVVAALALSGLIGLVMPVMDAVPVPASAAEDGAGEGPAALESGPADSSTIEPDATAEEPPVTPPGSEQELDESPQGVGRAAPLECTTNNLYSMSRSGQLKQVTVQPDLSSARVSNIGTEALGGLDFNGLGVGPGGETVYAYNRGQGESTIFKFDVEAGRWNRGPVFSMGTDQIGAGAVALDGTYWLGAFSGATSFSLWSLDAYGETVSRRGVVAFGSPARGDANADIAFDAAGNMYIVRGSGWDLDIFRIDAAALEDANGLANVPVAETFPRLTAPLQSVSGVALDPSGVMFVGATNRLGYLTLPTPDGPPQHVPFDRANTVWDSTDLASCGYPSTVTLTKELPDGRVAPDDQFRINVASGGADLGSANTSGSEAGTQATVVGPVIVGAGRTVTISEGAIGQTDIGAYSPSWECSADSKILASGLGSSGSFTVPETERGSDIQCTLRNSIGAVEKSATPASGSAVRPGGVVRYTLTVDNSTGTVPVRANYRDYLIDVLDDAVFVDEGGDVLDPQVPEVTATGGLSFDPSEHWDATNQWLDIRGTVAPGNVGVLEFSVKANAETSVGPNGTQRELLVNKVARGAATTPPEQCEPGGCTEHPVTGWTVSKAGLPAAGTPVAAGGIVHYSVTATMLSTRTRLEQLELQDDVTQVFRTAGWAPDAAAGSGARSRGVYIFNAEGRTIGVDGQPNTENASISLPVQDVAEPAQTNVAGAGSPEDIRWLVTSGEPLTLPAEAVRAEMWFAVQVGERPVGVPGGDDWEGGRTPLVTGTQIVNYATGMAQEPTGSSVSPFPPTECATGVDTPDTGLDPSSENAADPDFPSQCQVQHGVSANAFTIRKDAGGQGVAQYLGDPEWGTDPQGLWNMVGHDFQLRDNDAGKPSSYPAVQLCRTEYDPERAGWDGEWIAPSRAGDAQLWDFGAEKSDTQQAILDWNNEHPDDPRPMCGTFYETKSGPEQGGWRSAHVQEGEYWLAETKAPSGQANLSGSAVRSVAGVQKLAEVIPLSVTDPGGQLEVGRSSGAVAERCSPESSVAERPTACVDPSGYLVLVKDPAPAPLPLSGGNGLSWLVAGGMAALLAAAAGALWRRNRARQFAQVASS